MSNDMLKTKVQLKRRIRTLMEENAQLRAERDYAARVLEDVHHQIQAMLAAREEPDTEQELPQVVGSPVAIENGAAPSS